MQSYYNLLIVLQNFENLWNMYSVSEGALYNDKVKRSAKVFTECFNEITKTDIKLRNSKELRIDSKDSTERIDYIIEQIEHWITGTSTFPFHTSEIGMGDNEHSRFVLQPFFLCLSVHLAFYLKLKYMPVLCKSTGEGAYHKNNVKWRDHFSWLFCDQVDNEFLNSLSATETIVIVGDIRRSQDLITYSDDPDSYRVDMSLFIAKIRKIVLDHNGIFDRYTGDGFICYFSEHIANKINANHFESAMSACIEIQQYSKSVFERWQLTLRRLPHETIGLSIGIDAGKMCYSGEETMFAIGTPAVWATRMCSAGLAGDIILNNIPHAKVATLSQSYKFEEIYKCKKNDEKFKAYRLLYEL